MFQVKYIFIIDLTGLSITLLSHHLDSQYLSVIKLKTT